MDPTTSNFEELTTHWSSGDNLYGSGCQLNDAAANTIFELSFSNESNKFFAELIKNKQSSNSTEIKYTISKWNDIKPIDPQFTNIKQRKLTTNGTESGIAFFLRKNITTNITQTAFFHQDSIIIYSVAQTRTETKESDYFVIDRWSITSGSDHNEVSVAINANILWKSYQTPAATIIKSKWLRFYQSKFDRWRNLMKEHIEEYNKSEKIVLMTPFIGVWNKLNSIHSINIMMDKIEYSDGSQFEVYVDSARNEIVATYAKSTFNGKLFKQNDYDAIRWNNGSIWIKNGFRRFEGTYTHDLTQQMYIVNGCGTITLPMNARKIRYKVLKANRIIYNLNKSVVHKGTLCHNKDNQQIIKWDNGSVWERINAEKEENVEPLWIEEKSEEIDVGTKKTSEIEGETNVPSINIQHDDHFVLINDEEILGIKRDENGQNTLDEWLLV